MPLELSVNKLWRSGTEWLKSEVDREPLPDELPQPCAAEIKVSAMHSLLTTPSHSIGNVIDCERFSTIHKCYRVTAYALKFLKMVKKKVQSPELTS